MKRIFKYIKFLYLRVFLSNTEYARYIGVKIGDNCRIYIRDFGSEPWLITIGNKVTITHGVRFINHDGSTWLIEDHKGRRQLFRRIQIGNNVFVGMNSIILPGIKIGNNVVVAAGSVLTKSVPDNTIVGGNPARYITSFDRYRNKVLNEYVSNSDIDFNESYKDRVNKICDPSFKDNIGVKYESK